MLKQNKCKGNNWLGRVGVLMKGPSSESMISLKSGRAVLKALMGTGIEAIPVVIETDDVGENARLIRSKDIDVAFIALHGKFGEDGTIQRILSSLKIPYTGSGVRASRLAMDKVASRNIFRRNNLNVPKSRVIARSPAREDAVSGLKFPIVVKPVSHGSSIGFSIIKKAGELEKAVRHAFKFDERVIVEEFIRGREITVGIFRDNPLPIIEIVPKHGFFDYKSKYNKGLTDYIVPARLSPAVEKKAKKDALSAHRILGCRDFSRVDIIVNEENKPYILEINTIPGFTEFSLLPKAARHAGIDFGSLCVELIGLAYEKK